MSLQKGDLDISMEVTYVILCNFEPPKKKTDMEKGRNFCWKSDKQQKFDKSAQLGKKKNDATLNCLIGPLSSQALSTRSGLKPKQLAV